MFISWTGTSSCIVGPDLIHPSVGSASSHSLAPHSYQPLLPTQTNGPVSNSQTLVWCVLLRLPWSGCVSHLFAQTIELAWDWDSSKDNSQEMPNIHSVRNRCLVSCLDKKTYSMRTRKCSRYCIPDHCRPQHCLCIQFIHATRLSSREYHSQCWSSHWKHFSSQNAWGGHPIWMYFNSMDLAVFKKTLQHIIWFQPGVQDSWTNWDKKGDKRPGHRMGYGPRAWCSHFRLISFHRDALRL